MFILNMKLNDTFLIDIEVKQIFLPQTSNQADKLQDFCNFYRGPAHIYIYIICADNNITW